MLYLLQNNKAMPKQSRVKKEFVEKQSLVPNQELAEIQAPKRQNWFNDPHLLSERINQITKKSLNGHGDIQEATSEIVDLINRHTGSSNSKVFGIALNGLTKMGQYEKALYIYQLMTERKLKPTEQTLTTLLDLLSHLNMSVGHLKNINSSGNGVNENFELAMKLYSSAQPSTIHLNSILRFLSTCPGMQGYDEGLKIFKEADPCLYDSITYSQIFKILSLCPSLKNQHYCHELFKAAESKNLIDDFVLLDFIGFYKSAVHMNTTFDFILSVIEVYFGLPSTRNKSFNRGEKYRPINIIQLTALLKISLRMKNPAMGIFWYQLVQKELNLKSDEKMKIALVQ